LKNIFRFFFICLLFTTYIYMDKNFLKTETFFIKNVNLQGDTQLLSKELEVAAEALKGELIWDIDTSEIEAILEEDVRIEKAMVEKKIPNELTIKIKTKRPRNYILYKEQIYLLDGEKRAFSYMDEFPIMDLPILSVKRMDEIEELWEILERLKGKQLEKLISQLYIKDENCIEVILLDGTIIKTKSDVTEEKYNLAERLYLKLKSEDEALEYIDIRFGDYIVR